MNQIILLLLLISTLLLSGTKHNAVVLPVQTKQVSLVLPWKHQFQFAGYYVAKELGFYEKVGLDVNIKEYDSSRNNVLDVTSGKYDFGVGHSSLIFDKLSKYPNIVLMNAIHQSSPLVLLSLQRDDIKTITDIKNKKIMMLYDQKALASIRAMLTSNNLSKDTYQVRNENFKIIDLVNGTVDLRMAYSSNEPYILKSKGLKYTIFDPKEYGYDFYSDLLFTSTQMIQNNPQDVAAFYKASLEGWIYAYNHIDETIKIILKKYNTQAKTYEAYKFEAESLKKLAFKDGVEFASIDKRKIQETINTYRLLHLGKMNKTLNYDTFIYKYIDDINLTNTSFSKVKNNQTKAFPLDSIEIQIFLGTVLILILLFLYIYNITNIEKMKGLLKDASKNHFFNKHTATCTMDINGIITSISPAMLSILEYSEDELLGQHYSLLKSDTADDTSIKEFWLTVSSGHTYNKDIRIKKKDNTDINIHAIISPLLDKNNVITEYISLHHIIQKPLDIEFES